MKYRQSGMPEESYWESLFDIPLILDRLGIDARLSDVVELGCGYGTFAIEVARRISGTLVTLDIDPEMALRTRQRLLARGLSNVRVEVRDVVHDGFGVTDASQDGCLLFNILHGEDPITLLAQSHAALRPSGRLFVIHWRHDATTPRGPSMDIRPTPEQCIDWVKDAGFTLVSEHVLDLPPYHWGMVLRRG